MEILKFHIFCQPINWISQTFVVYNHDFLTSPLSKDGIEYQSRMPFPHFDIIYVIVHVLQDERFTYYLTCFIQIIDDDYQLWLE